MAKIVCCHQKDFVEIIIDEDHTIRFPASLILAVDKVLRYERIAAVELKVRSYLLGNDREFEAALGYGEFHIPYGRGSTPLEAIKALADRL